MSTKQKNERSLKQHFINLRENLKKMTFKEKADHIWTYYKWHFLTAVCVFAIVGGLLYGIFAPKPVIHIGGVQCNIKLSTEGYDYLNKVFQQEVLEEKNGKTELNTFYFYGEYTVDAMNDTYKAHSSVTAYVENEQLDYMLTDLYSFKYFAGDRIFLDLRQVLTATELAQLDAEGLILYDQPEGTTELIPYAIDIANTPFIKENSDAAECYLVFIRNTPRLENCRKLWQHIKNYKGEE